jgi:hypothetical protein
MLRKFPFVFLALILAACTPAPLPLSTPTPFAGQIDLEQQAVYAALLHNLYTSTNFVIMDTTATSPGGVKETNSSLDFIVQNLPGLDSETTDNFRARNLTAYPVSPQMDLSAPYVLLSRANMSQIFRTAGRSFMSDTLKLQGSRHFLRSASIIPMARHSFTSAQ